MRRVMFYALCLFLLLAQRAQATIFGQVRGVVHDPQHRPVSGAKVTIHAVHSDFRVSQQTGIDGSFQFAAVPIGEYTLTVTQSGFGAQKQALTLTSEAGPILHFQLEIESVQQSIEVSPEAGRGSVDSVTPTTLVGRSEIAQTAGADRTNSLDMITSFVPGAYMTHDMLHVRGGHQVSWLIDGVQIPNTNIGSNLGAQIDPKDIDYLEVQRGSYNADVGDRTYGVFNVVPRSGFERNREGEAAVSFGNFLQTDDQINLGDHTETSAYYASLNGSRSDYGLATPVKQIRHDAANGYGGLASLLYNRTAHDQLRVLTQLRADSFQIPFDPDPNSAENQQYDSSGLRDMQHEADAVAAFTWAHTFRSDAVLQLSPFFHYNRADYEARASDLPAATTSDRASSYAGLQASMSGEFARNTVQAGVYSFGQRDSYRFGSQFNDGSAADFLITNKAAGGLTEEFLSDNIRVRPWLTLIGGVRASQFFGGVTERAVAARVGVAVEVPKVGWVVRAFYGHYYQPPPLLTAAGPIVAYANSQNTTFEPLHGERDEEHQFGVQIPWRGWVVDADTFRTRARGFLDHSNLGESSIYFPVTIDGALVEGWEATVRSPRVWKGGQAHLAYSNQVAKQRGAITGGLVCFPVSSPGCAGDMAYTPLDHDQRNTLSAGYSTPVIAGVGASADVFYGSGFHNGAPNARYPERYLPQHTAVNLSVSKRFGEKTTVSVTAVNVANQRVLLDNSLTFGGFHFSDPRQIYGQVRFRFPY